MIAFKRDGLAGPGLGWSGVQGRRLGSLGGKGVSGVFVEISSLSQRRNEIGWGLVLCVSVLICTVTLRPIDWKGRRGGCPNSHGSQILSLTALVATLSQSPLMAAAKLSSYRPRSVPLCPVAEADI